MCRLVNSIEKKNVLSGAGATKQESFCYQKLYLSGSKRALYVHVLYFTFVRYVCLLP